MNPEYKYQNWRKESVPPDYFNKKSKPMISISISKPTKVKMVPQILLKGLEMEVRVKRSQSLQRSLRLKYTPHLKDKSRSRSQIQKSSNWLQPEKPIRRRSCEGSLFGFNSKKHSHINKFITVTMVREHLRQREQEKRERRRRAYKLQTMTKAAKEPENKKVANQTLTKQNSSLKSRGKAYITNNSLVKNKQQPKHRPQPSKDLNSSYKLINDSSTPKNNPVIYKEQILNQQNSIPLYMNNLQLTDEIIESEPVLGRKSPTKSKEQFSSKTLYRQRSSEMNSGPRVSWDKSFLPVDPNMTIEELDWRINQLIRMAKSKQIIRKIAGALDDFNIQYTTTEVSSPAIKKPTMLQRQKTLKNPQYCGTQSESRISSGSIKSIKPQKYKLILYDKQSTLQVIINQGKLRSNKTMENYVNQFSRTPIPKSPQEPPKSINSYGQISIGQDKRSFLTSLQTQTFISGQSLRTQHHNTQVFPSRADNTPMSIKGIFERKSCHDLLINTVRVKTTPLTPYGRLLTRQRPTRESMS